MARADAATVEHMLHRQIDVDPFTLARDFDAITQSGNRTVSPVRTAVLGDVLVEGLGEVVGAICVVAP